MYGGISGSNLYWDKYIDKKHTYYHLELTDVYILSICIKTEFLKWINFEIYMKTCTQIIEWYVKLRTYRCLGDYLDENLASQC